MDGFEPTERTRLRRLPQRGVFDKPQIYAILDEGYFCHAGFVSEGKPYVIPMMYVRAGDKVYIHGAVASRTVRTLAEGADVCLTVTLLDGLVLARSAFHHSMNYRSVVVFGKARPVSDADEKKEALRCLTNRVSPGRWDLVRKPTEPELKATSVLALPLDEVSAKIRTGPPLDDEEDLSLPVWAGVVPIRMRMEEPVPAGPAEL